LVSVSNAMLVTGPSSSQWQPNDHSDDCRVAPL
jgi:hypothetical protein